MKSGSSSEMTRKAESYRLVWESLAAEHHDGNVDDGAEALLMRNNDNYVSRAIGAKDSSKMNQSADSDTSANKMSKVTSSAKYHPSSSQSPAQPSPQSPMQSLLQSPPKKVKYSTGTTVPCSSAPVFSQQSNEPFIIVSESPAKTVISRHAGSVLSTTPSTANTGTAKSNHDNNGNINNDTTKNKTAEGSFKESSLSTLSLQQYKRNVELKVGDNDGENKGKSLAAKRQTIISHSFPCVRHALSWATQGKDADISVKDPNASIPDIPASLEDADHIQVLVTGSLHLVGAILSVLDPNMNDCE